MSRSRVLCHSVRLFLILAAPLCLTTCQRNHVQNLSVWHFWTEPRQKVAFNNLITEFERENPDVHVVTTELLWSDGKAKLQTAYASGHPPDVVHLGYEWVNQFATAGVLDSIPADVLRGTAPDLLSGVTVDKHAFAIPWVMNSRALFVHRDIFHDSTQSHSASHSKESDGENWNDLLRVINYGKNHRPVLRVGINAYEPHNILKKVLPFLWSTGSTVFQSLPLSSTFDAKSERGLTLYCDLAKDGVIESSRSLDDRMKHGELSVWVSGMWNLEDESVERQYAVKPQMYLDPLNTQKDRCGWGVLSADCFAISAGTKHSAPALAFVRFLATAEARYEFCRAVPDAGFPATLPEAASDTVGSLSIRTNRDNFWDQTIRARTLPTPPYFLEAEQILEEEIMEAVYSKKTPADALASAQRRISILENH